VRFAIPTLGLAQLSVTLLLTRLAHITTGLGTPPLVSLDSSPAAHAESCAGRACRDRVATYCDNDLSSVILRVEADGSL
jgi:hypothetical protein